MDDLERLLLRRVYESADRFSRNRHFHAYADPTVQRTARIARILRSLREDFSHDPIPEIQLTWPDDGGLIVLSLSWPNRHRTSYLTTEELALLCEDNDVFALLKHHLPGAFAKAG